MHPPYFHTDIFSICFLNYATGHQLIHFTRIWYSIKNAKYPDHLIEHAKHMKRVSLHIACRFSFYLTKTIWPYSVLLAILLCSKQ